jgi:NADH dehydrogenase FAD-containing subunit
LWAHDPDRSRWIINDGYEGDFDAVVVTIGTCGEPLWFSLPGMPKLHHDSETEASKEPEPHSSAKRRGEDEETFSGVIVHSSQLDSPSFTLENAEKVVIIGSGASGVEAVETVLNKFGGVAEKGGKDVKVYMIARHDKWIIPRNVIIDIGIAAQPFGREMPLRCVESPLH